MRFGERLIRAGLVAPELVEDALRKQVMLPLRLGNYLVQLGALDIDVLADALSEHTGFPAAKLKHFDQISKAILAKVPKHLARKHRACPLALVSRPTKELLVAFCDPGNVPAVDEIAFVTGVKIRPFVAAELCMFHYLERYYGVVFETAMVPLPRQRVGPTGHRTAGATRCRRADRPPSRQAWSRHSSLGPRSRGCRCCSREHARGRRGPRVRGIAGRCRRGTRELPSPEEHRGSSTRADDGASRSRRGSGVKTG